jgi:hypothetical protein
VQAQTINFTSDFVFQQVDVEVDSMLMLEVLAVTLAHLVIHLTQLQEPVLAVFQTTASIMEFAASQTITQTRTEHVLLVLPL